MNWSLVAAVIAVCLAVAQLTLSWQNTRGLLRTLRRGTRWNLMLFFATTISLAASPVGAWVLDRWERVPLLQGPIGATVITAMLLTGRMVANRISLSPRVPLIPAGMLGLVNQICARPTGLFTLVAFHQASAGVGLAACLSGAVMTAVTAHYVLILHSPQQAAANATVAMGLPKAERESSLRDWLRVAVLGRRRPDLRLPFMILERARAASNGRSWSGLSAERMRKNLFGWEPVLEQILTLLDEALPGHPAHTALKGRIELLRVQVPMLRHAILENLDRREEAALALDSAAELVTDPAHIRLLRVMSATYRGSRLGLAEDARIELEAILAEDDLDPTTRSLCLSGLLIIVSVLGDTQAAAGYLVALGNSARPAPLQRIGIRGYLGGGRQSAAMIRQHGMLSAHVADSLAGRVAPAAVRRRRDRT